MRVIARALVPRPRAARARALTPAVLALALAGCGDTLQDQPISHSALETLIAAPYPVYWLGHAFRGLAITEASRDPSGAFSVQYGDCKQGGQGTCVAPLRVVTSPDNSFRPAGSAPARAALIRGVPASLALHGRAIALATAGVVVSIYALDAELAYAAAQTAVPINEVSSPGAPLPPALPDTGFAETPLAAQMPSPLAPPPRSP
jgi:hypothetical protein